LNQKRFNEITDDLEVVDLDYKIFGMLESFLIFESGKLNDQYMFEARYLK